MDIERRPAAIIVTRLGDEVLLCGSQLAALAPLVDELYVIRVGSRSSSHAAVDATSLELGVTVTFDADDLAAAGARLAAARPSLVVTTAAGRAALDAIVTACPPAAVVYRYCLPAWLFRFDPVAVARLGLAPCVEGDISTVIDTAALRRVRERAIARLGALAVPLDLVPAVVRRTLLTSDHLQRVRPPWSGGPLQTTLANFPVSQPTTKPKDQP